MRKIVCPAMLIVLLCLLSACFSMKYEEEHIPAEETEHAVVQSEISFSEENAPNQASENIANIDFRYIYRGFSPVSLDDGQQMENYMSFGTKVIVRESDWNAFLASYCPGIPCDDARDFSQECLIASIVSGARPAYANSNTITGLSWENGYFSFEYENDPSHYLYALNSSDVTHFYVEIVAISKEDFPEGAESWAYQP